MTTNNDLSATHTHTHMWRYYALQCTKSYALEFIHTLCGRNARRWRPYSFAIELCLLIRHTYAHMDTNIDRYVYTHARTHIKRTNEQMNQMNQMNESILTKVLYTIHSLSVYVFFPSSSLQMSLIFFCLRSTVCYNYNYYCWWWLWLAIYALISR